MPITSGWSAAITFPSSLFDVFRPAKDIVEAFGRRLGALADNRPVLPPAQPAIDYLALLDDVRRQK